MVLTVQEPTGPTGPTGPLGASGASGPSEPTGPSRDAAELLPEGLVLLGARGVEQLDDGALRVYLPEPTDVEEFLAEARHHLLAHTGLSELRMEWSWQAHEDWAELWKQGLGPRQVSERIIVAPSWDPPVDPGDSIVVTIDPGMAFGTAEHATTRGCIRLLDAVVKPGERVADVGSGSGILSIIVTRLGARAVTAIEHDPLAGEAARDNLSANGVAEVVEWVSELATSESLDRLGPFDGIVSNIETEVLRRLMPGFRAALAPGGWLILSGILQAEVQGFLADTTGFLLDAEDREDEWWAGLFRRAR